MKKLIYIGLASFLLLSAILSPTYANNAEYQFPWPGILPDQVFLYKLKVLRNKVIQKILYSNVSRVEFDLLMADKTLYAAKLLMEKGNLPLARETAFKGENYFSTLVSDYAKVSKEVPKDLNDRIDRAFEAHQILILHFIEVAREEDKQSYKDIDYFSKINYQMILEIRENNIKDI